MLARTLTERVVYSITRGRNSRHLGSLTAANWASFDLNVAYSSLGSENRDRGGIQWNSEPTSTPSPLLKINTNYVGFSGLSNL